MSKKKYSFELKREIVMRYLNELISLKALSVIYGPCISDIQKWVAVYKKHGNIGLNTKNGNYTGDFRISVIEYMKSTDSSARQAAAHFNIPSYSTVCKWKHIYYSKGKDALFFRQPGTAMIKPRKRKKATKTTDIETLIAENKRLKMENDYLKKLNALVQERECSQKRIK